MKTSTVLFTAIVIGMTVSIALARDPGPDEALRLRDAGTIVSFEMRDAQGVEWNLELDAVSGQVLKDHQDT